MYFSILFNCVIRWPVLCHYGAQAWVEAAGEQGLALQVSNRSSSTRSSLPVCLSGWLALHISVVILQPNLCIQHINANLASI